MTNYNFAMTNCFLLRVLGITNTSNLVFLTQLLEQEETEETEFGVVTVFSVPSVASCSMFGWGREAALCLCGEKSGLDR